MAIQIQPPADPYAPFLPSPEQPFETRWLGHLFRRAGFGLSDERLRQFNGTTPRNVIDWLFDFDPASDPFNAMADGLEGFVNLTRWEMASSFWLHRMLYTPRPLQEKVALFWHNRFATALSKVGNGRLLHRQIELFRQKGLGSYRELLVDLGRDPAMLVWLDGQANVKGQPNENYAREIMELFTLGIGHYTEADVKELARAFTGWRLEYENAIFDPNNFDDGEKTILAQKGNFNSESAIDVLLAQPAAPPLLARSLLREFVHPAPRDADVEHYARRAVELKWQIGPLLREMLSSRLMFSEWAYRSRIKSPVELAVGAALGLGGKVNPDWLRDVCTRMGQMPLNPPNVKGWPGGEAWINASTVLLRFNFAMQLASSRGGEFVRRNELLPWLERNNIRSADDILRHFALLYVDDAISPEARSKLKDYMSRNDKNEPAKFELHYGMVESKVKGVIHLLLAMPEFQLA